ncbi:hypothetical protein GWN42_26035 [candidate division KSB1 bacterium]|nr:hypothetical protein [candidate division KSB1 bacterium]
MAKHYLIHGDDARVESVVNSQRAAKEAAKENDLLITVSSPDDLKNEFNKNELGRLAVSLGILKPTGKKDETVVLVWEKLVEVHGSKKGSGERKPTKVSKLRDAFAEKDSWTEDELVEKTGYDTKNLRTALGILRSDKRTPADKILSTVYVRRTKTYYIAGTEPEDEGENGDD